MNLEGVQHEAFKVGNPDSQGTAFAAKEPFLVEMLHQDLLAGNATATFGVDYLWKK